MDIGKYQLVISVSVILASAVVALLFDYLKRNNEALREANMELKVRRARELKKARMGKSPGKTLEGNEANSMSVSDNTASSAPAGKRFEETSGLDAIPSSDSTMVDGPSLHTLSASDRFDAAMAERLRELATLANLKPVADSNIPESAILPTLADHLKIAAVLQKQDTQWTDGPVGQQAVELKPEPVAAIAEAITAAEHQAIEPADTGSGSRRNWGALLKAARPSKLTDIFSSDAVFGGKESVHVLPAGFHSDLVLESLLKVNLEVSGLVVSIGASAHNPAAAPAVAGLVRSMLKGKDFAARCSDEEFLLILPEDTGAASQRRLNRIAQQLWDHQIDSLRDEPVAFAWGGLEVTKQPITEAMVAAAERMWETKRNRKALPMERERGIGLPQTAS